MEIVSELKVNIIFILIALLSISSCTKEKDLIVEGMSPSYVSPTDFTQIRTENPKPFIKLGNIVNKGDYIFIVDVNKGVHVLDNINPENPKKIYFWRIPGCTEITIEDNILFADNSFHLLAIDISDFSSINVVNYIKDIYSDKGLYEYRPPSDYNGYFVCADKKNGILTGWELKILTNPQCETIK